MSELAAVMGIESVILADVRMAGLVLESGM
jgi:hypothetical protein